LLGGEQFQNNNIVINQKRSIITRSHGRHSL
jgi:hypothetical protein